MARIIPLLVISFLVIWTTDGADVEVSSSGGDNDYDAEGVYQIGQDVTLLCEVEGAALGANVKWYKRQGDREYMVAYDSLLQEPFSEFDRFSSNIQARGSSSLDVEIGISVIQLEDSGEYRCVYQDGPDEEFSEWMTIAVADGFSAQMVARRSGFGNVEETLENGQIVDVDEDDEWNVRCEFRGGNPPADVRVSLGIFNLTQYFDVNVESRVVPRPPFANEGNTDGLNYIETDVVVSSREPLEVTHESNRRNLTCTGYVPGLDSVEVYVQPTLQFAPVIHCTEEEITVDEFQRAKFWCVVKADPPLLNMFWTFEQEEYETSNKTLYPGDHYGRYYFGTEEENHEQNLVSDETFATLTIDGAYIQTFRQYTLVAENRRGINFKNVELKLGERRAGASSLQVSLIAMLTLFIAAIYSQNN